MDFSALDVVGNSWVNASSQLNRISEKGLVVFMCFNGILWYIMSTQYICGVGSHKKKKRLCMLSVYVNKHPDI